MSERPSDDWCRERRFRLRVKRDGGPPQRLVQGTAFSPFRRTATPKTTLITNIRRTPLPDGVRITIEMDAEVASFHEERIAGPSRIFVDLPSARAGVRPRRSDAPVRRRRPRPPGSDRTSSEFDHPGRARRDRCLEVQRLPALQPVSSGHRLRTGGPGSGGDGRLVRFTAIAAAACPLPPRRQPAA